ncbi:MAG: phosphotransferase [Pseudomonadota bacterium]
MGFDSDARDALIDRFLSAAGWGDAARAPLGQDASTRRYIRLTRQTGETALLMDAPPVEDEPCPPDADEATRLSMGWNATSRLAASRVGAFVDLSDHLRGRGFSAPEILASDRDEGLALIEDFGASREFARLIERGEEDETELYVAAGEGMAVLHREPAPKQVGDWPILDYDRLALQVNADLFFEWLPQLEQDMRASDADAAHWAKERDALIEQALGFPREFGLRDYHAENLLWLPEREGIARVGLLDFQDAVNGWDGWEMAMLVQDARRPVSAEAHEGAVRAYLDGTGKGRADFDARLAVLGALNALRITGLFARLPVRDGKQRYLNFMPRQQELLARNLQHPACQGMAAFVRETAPFIFEARG